MTINIGNSSISNIYLGDTAVKSVYLGDNLVYSKQSEPVIEIDDSYNYYVFDTSKVSDSTTVILQNYRGGDTTEWDGLTDWGDGTADTNLSHTYAKSGTYTVKTKYVINKVFGIGDEYTINMLIKCTNINNNITNCSYLFSCCKNLTYINTADFDTSNVTNMKHMFYLCNSLTSLDLSNWNTSNVTNMEEMFVECLGLTLLDLSSFNTNKVTDMYGIFRGCYNLSWIYLTNWDMSNVTEYTNMFHGCDKLTITRITMTNCDYATRTKIQEALSAK